MKQLAASLLLASGLCGTAAAQAPAPQAATTSADQRMQWFDDAKLGIFIHWGIYAAHGTSESWSFFNGETTWPQYMSQKKDFTARNYDAQGWADLIKRSGARYAVLTSRHHDGVALWNSKKGLNVVRDTPAKRDLIGPFVDALRKDKLKVGLYYSLPDWSYSDYDVFTREKKRYDIKAEPARWQRYLAYYQEQVRDVGERYNPDLYWFDGDWEHSAEEWQAQKTRAMILAHNPNAIINSRLAGHGDYGTPEQGVPIHKPTDRYWELCLTMNMSWGYRPSDNAYKTPGQLIRIFADTISMGGNLLLDIGPKEDGSIDERQVQILEEFGRWTGKHGEAIYGSLAGIPLDYFHGPSTLSADGRKLYLFVDGRPNEDLVIKGLDNQVLRARVVGSNATVGHQVVGKFGWSKVPGLLYLDVPKDAFDPVVTVIALELDKPVSLFSDQIKPIESN
ncbi:alpha-L-fucosidase [Lysobacter sp. Root494]|uniref:alpha-L-fucosidase n=1 Tax=Lysobacter sp. Root494 TaxID=1736549 RepID=UPI0006F4B980|nr:alpha-L-fucosidase [Lysobacter sp. Root494]KQY52440.1 alpha-L-fucosidase [Lysobacter sp. Root494]